MDPDGRPRPSVITGSLSSGGAGPSSGRGWEVEQSPVAHSHGHASDCPSDVFSWGDDASSSLTCSAAGGTITVNTQRMRMGEHLKGKLEGMIRQRFENYLQIIRVVQNDIGTLAALECELGHPFSTGERLLVSIACNEDGTFFVYLAPEAAVAAAAASSSQDWPGDQSASGDEEQEASDPGQLLRKWVEQVCEFGMSGRCHSLTALFHFGYTTWSVSKQGRTMALNPTSLSAVWSADNAKITEEEEHRDLDTRAPLHIEESLAPASGSATGAASSSQTPSPGSADAKRGKSVTMLLMAAQQALDDGQHSLALDHCSEALRLLPASGHVSSPGLGGCASASSAGSEALLDGETAQAMQQVLLLRASVQMTLHNFDAALQDAERLISLQPTCAEGYYWQSIALQGMHRSQEALEALMSALEYDPQNSLFQHTFTILFEEISASSLPKAASSTASTTTRTNVLHGERSRRSRLGQLGDALSTTTQATHLSSRSTTPTEVSAPQSRSSSQDSLYIIGETTEDHSQE